MSSKQGSTADQARAYLAGRSVCVTGQLASMTQAELAEFVLTHGGTFLATPRGGDFTLVIGSGGPAASSKPSIAFQRAHDLSAAGHQVDFLLEEEFLERIGLLKSAADVYRHFTIGDLSRILERSPAQLRRWARLGLIEPVDPASLLLYFDYQQASWARQLNELVGQGVPVSRIREELQRVQRWLPEVGLSQLFPHIVQWAPQGRILARHGRFLLSGEGQQHFDFAEHEEFEPTIVAEFAPGDEVDALFEAALNLEDANRLEDAVGLYLRAIEADPLEPVLRFNLGNVLYRLQGYSDSLGCFEEAVRLDPHYAEAWNNLGNVYAEVERFEDAVRALRRSLALMPGYALAGANLEHVLKRTGKGKNAVQHLRVFE